MAQKKEPEKMLTARVPAKLVKQIDRAAEKARRNRTKEVIVRLEASFLADRERSPA